MELGGTFKTGVPYLQVGPIKVQLEKDGLITAWKIGDKSATKLELGTPEVQQMVTRIQQQETAHEAQPKTPTK